MIDPADRLVADAIDPGDSFLDVGPLWGRQRLSLARQHGAGPLAACDMMPEADPLWDALSTSLGPLAAETTYYPADYLAGTVPPHDVVHCSGVLYHCPQPLDLLSALFLGARKQVVLGTVVSDPTIRNRHGSAHVPPGSALFLPATPPDTLKVLREHWKDWLGGKPGGALSQPQPWTAWDLASYHPWWWLFSPTYVVALAQLVGFHVRGHVLHNRILTLRLARDLPILG